MMKKLGWILNLIFTISALADAGQCPSIDYRERFTSPRDQSGNGLCWAFAGTALIEEQRCLEDPSTCGKEQVSIIDGHRCFWNSKQGLATRKTGALATGYYTECVIKKGVCLEEHSPFIKTDNFVSQNHYNKLVVRALQNTIKSKIRNGVGVRDGCIVGSSSGAEKFLEDLGDIVVKLADDMSDDYGELNIDYKGALLNSKHYTDALKGIYITQSCKDSRVHIKEKNIRPRFKFIEFKPVNEKLNLLTEKLKQGRSVSIGLCGRRARKGRFEDLIFLEKWGTTKEEFQKEVQETKCGDHSVVINAMRFKDGRCQVYVRNSWTSGSGLEGWEDAENIMKHTKTLEYLEKK